MISVVSYDCSIGYVVSDQNIVPLQKPETSSGVPMKIINVKETALLLGVKEKTVYQWAENRQIPHLKLNGALRFEESEVLTWIESCRKSPLQWYNRSTKIEAREGGKQHNEPR